MMPYTEQADIEIELVETFEDRAAVFELRMTVFVEEQRVPPEEELDAHDVAATHFLVRCRKAGPDYSRGIVATARLVRTSVDSGKVGRVAVYSKFRRLGLGAALMRFIEAYSRTLGYRRLDLEAQCYAIPFYEKLGYKVQGDIFLDCDIEHRYMSKSL